MFLKQETIGYINNKIMSSYLTFYAKNKDNEKPIPLIRCSRNSEIYQQFQDTICPAYAGVGTECKYTELTVAKVDSVIDAIKEDLRKAEVRLHESEKHAGGNMDIIEYIIEQKEYIEDLQNALNQTIFIRDIVVDASYSWKNHVILCNID